MGRNAVPAMLLLVTAVLAVQLHLAAAGVRTDHIVYPGETGAFPACVESCTLCTRTGTV